MLPQPCLETPPNSTCRVKELPCKYPSSCHCNTFLSHFQSIQRGKEDAGVEEPEILLTTSE